MVPQLKWITSDTGTAGVPNQAFAKPKTRIHRDERPDWDDYGGAIDKSDTESSGDDDPAHAQADYNPPVDDPWENVRYDNDFKWICTP